MPAGSPSDFLQATCVLVGADAVLIRGRPGSGKSALAAALLARDGPRCPVRLVGDDAVRVRPVAGRLVALAPERMRGMLEMRGIGLIAVASETRAVVRLVVDLVEAAAIERLPAAAGATTNVSGIVLPRVTLLANDCATIDRVWSATAAVRSDRHPGAGETGSARNGGCIRA